MDTLSCFDGLPSEDAIQVVDPTGDPWTPRYTVSTVHGGGTYVE
eukprot:CAMPEP_0174925388 /NCGR_PEP_ID=MMETSP1355-20121228/7876_1 /TAXON_ID=464990 /ORGANISM="Hemiselmis tepida, Strain CCMP443" /LENGTH=43 /DNA_ID= /DNA_START= /DNA_END= /DNA_ORIENTATION=